MQIWQLTPMREDSPDWNLSTFRGKVLIRATDESTAREIATRAFAIAAKVEKDRSTRFNPWTNSNLVSCKAVSDVEFSTEGPSELLSPKV